MVYDEAKIYYMLYTSTNTYIHTLYIFANTNVPNKKIPRTLVYLSNTVY